MLMFQTTTQRHKLLQLTHHLHITDQLLDIAHIIADTGMLLITVAHTIADIAAIWTIHTPADTAAHTGDHLTTLQAMLTLAILHTSMLNTPPTPAQLDTLPQCTKQSTHLQSERSTHLQLEKRLCTLHTLQ
jgi:hypothetical protein